VEHSLFYDRENKQTSNFNAWREFRDCLNEDHWFIDKDGRRETLARIIVKHNLNDQYREFAHAVAFFDCCEFPGGSYQNTYENNKFTLRRWIEKIRKKKPLLKNLEPRTP
jgi:hypothetical protein